MADSKVVAPSVQSKPRRTRRPKMDPSQIPDTVKTFRLTTDPIMAPPPGDVDSLLYTSGLSPAVVLSFSPFTSPAVVFAANYEKYKILSFKATVLSLAPEAISSYNLSVVWFPDASEGPTSLQATNLSMVRRYHSILPGQSGSLSLTASELLHGIAEKYVDPTHSDALSAFCGLFMVVCHGAPFNHYRDTQYLGPLFKIQFEFKLSVFGYSPGNIPVKVQGTSATEIVSFGTVDGKATFDTPSAIALHAPYQSGPPNSPGPSIGQVLLTVADTVSAALPFPFSVLAKVGLFFIRKITGINGTSFMVYKSYGDAIRNRPLPSRSSHQLGNSLVRQITFGTNDDSVLPPQPISQFTFHFKTGDSLIIQGSFKAPTSRPGNWNVQEFSVLRILNTTNGTSTTNILVFEKWTLDGHLPQIKNTYGLIGVHYFPASISPIGTSTFDNIIGDCKIFAGTAADKMLTPGPGSITVTFLPQTHGFLSQTELTQGLIAASDTMDTTDSPLTRQASLPMEVDGFLSDLIPSTPLCNMVNNTFSCGNSDRRATSQSAAHSLGPNCDKCGLDLNLRVTPCIATRLQHTPKACPHCSFLLGLTAYTVDCMRPSDTTDSTMDALLNPLNSLDLESESEPSDDDLIQFDD
nr:capsid protein [Cutthroat trout virus]